MRPSSSNSVHPNRRGGNGRTGSSAATATRVDALCVARLCGAILALSYACLAFSGPAGAGLTVTATVLPTRAQRLMAARISVRQTDGSTLVLNSQQQAQYVANPGSLGQHVRARRGDSLVVTVEY